MRLICVGLPRCATESLQHALLKLGFNGVYHGWIPLLDRDQGKHQRQRLVSDN